jgi:arabinofuranosyltransferase
MSRLFSKSTRWLIVAAFIAVIGYLFSASSTYRLGYPLDDAWIHQTYARNLMLHGSWEFQPGQPSAGSTSPLWTILLSPGFLVSSVPLFWSYFLGLVCLVGVAKIGGECFRILTKSANSIPWFGVFLAVEWHLVWAAVSGMETGLMALAILVVFYILFQENPNWICAGILTGLSLWVRPDGLTLLGPIAVILVFSKKGWRKTAIAFVKFASGFTIFTGLFLIFNYLLSGSPMPNTFYAKQAEYAITLQIPLLERYLSLLVLPLIGPGILLLPGFAFIFITSIKARELKIFVGCIWWLGYTLLYSVMLPVTYQHGRYLMPAMPIFFLLGAAGTKNMLERIKPEWCKKINRVGTAVILLVTFGFYTMGADSYGRDVAFIETEMVDTAQWLKANTEEDALLAVHDIGAVGFWSERKIVDLAGLVTPEIIPFIRDEERLAEYLNMKEVDYLVVFPYWYQVLPKYGFMVHSADGSAQGGRGQNMTVYIWLGNSIYP